MKQLHGVPQHPDQYSLHVCLGALVLAVKAGLCHLYVPVAELGPDEIIYLLRGDVELEVVHIGGDFTCNGVEPVEYPLVGDIQLCHVYIAYLLIANVHLNKARGVVDLIAEVSGGLHLFVGKAHVVARAVAGHQAEAQGIRAIVLDYLKGIYAVAKGFGHLAAQLVPDYAVYIYRVKGYLTHDLSSKHYHSGYPKEDYIVAGDEGAGGVEVFKLRGLVRPAQRGEGPHAGAEPCIQNVFVLMDLCAADGALFGRVQSYFYMAAVGILAVIGGYPVAPPELSGNTPVPDVVHPVEVGLVEPFRHELYLALLHYADSFFGKGLHAHEPLEAGEGLDGIMAAVADPYVVGVVLYLHKVAALFHIGHDSLAALHGSHAGIRRSQLVQVSVVSEYPYAGQVVAHAYFEIVGVVAGSDLNCAGAKLLLHVFVRNYGYLAAHYGDYDGLSDKIPIALILGVHGYGGIAGYCFWAGGGADYGIALVGRVVADVPEVAGLLLVLHLGVRKRRLAYGAPVDYPVVPIYKAFFVKVYKHLGDRPVAALVHGEAFTLPVTGGAHFTQLLYDGPAVLAAPLPCALEECFAAYVALVYAFLGHLGDYLYLGGYGGVIRAGKPERLVAVHALIAYYGILKGIIQGVAHVQLAGYVWRRHNYAVGFLFGVGFRMEVALLFPFFVEPAFHVGMVIGLGQFFAHVSSSCILRNNMQ